MSAIVVIPCMIAAWIITIVALKNRRGGSFLCDDCIFNDEKSCHRTERPRALSCTTYRSNESDGYRM